MRSQIARDRDGKFTAIPIDPAAKTRICGACKQEKPLSDFRNDETGIGGKKRTCGKCESKRTIAWKKRHPEKARALNFRNRLARYGMTPADFLKLLEMQKGRCAICGTKKPGGRGRFTVDHDHLTKRIRGLLCNNCNAMLGHAKDDVRALRRAIKYLSSPTGSESWRADGP